MTISGDARRLTPTHADSRQRSALNAGAHVVVGRIIFVVHELRAAIGLASLPEGPYASCQAYLPRFSLASQSQPEPTSVLTDFPELFLSPADEGRAPELLFPGTTARNVLVSQKVRLVPQLSKCVKIA